MSQGGTASINAGHEDGPSRIDPLRDRSVWTTEVSTQPHPQPTPVVMEPVCAICCGAGWVKEAVPFGHPKFGVLFPCQCKQTEWACQKAQELAQMSNLA